MLSPADQCVSLCVLRLHLCVMMMLMMASPSLTLSAPHFSVSRNPTPAQSKDRPISMTLGSTLHQRLCQQGLFRRGPVTDCDVAGVFGQNGVIQTRAEGRERQGEEWVRERERRVRQRRDRALRKGGEARQQRGWRNWQSSQ